MESDVHCLSRGADIPAGASNSRSCERKSRVKLMIVLCKAFLDAKGGLDDGMDSFPLLLFEVIAQVHEMKSCHFDEMVREKRVLKWTGPPVPFTCQQDDSDRESTDGGCEPEGSSSDFSGARGSQLGDEGDNRLV